MQTVYPADGRVRIAVGLPKSEAFALRLRIPQWSERTSLRINGAPYDGYLIPGTYASIERTWNEGDRIELDLDMRTRVVDAPSGSGDRAIVRGPVVLAFDTRLIPRRDGVSEPPMYRYEFDCDADGYIDAMPTESPVSGVAMTFDVPCLDEAADGICCRCATTPRRATHGRKATCSAHGSPSRSTSATCTSTTSTGTRT